MEELTIRKQSRELYALAGGSWDNKQFLMLCNWLSACIQGKSECKYNSRLITCGNSHPDH